MPTAGFLFASNNAGTNKTPAIVRAPVLGTTAINAGDLLVLDAATGYLKPAATGMTQVHSYALQARPTLGAASGDIISVGLIRKEHLFRVSTDAATTTALPNGTTQTLDLINQAKLKVSTITGGTVILWDSSKKDDAGNILALVSFSNTVAG